MPKGQKNQPPQVQPNRDDLIYAAGLFDGEGCIKFVPVSAKKPPHLHYAGRYNLIVEVNMANQPTVAWFAERFGGTLFSYAHAQRNGLPMHRWVTACKDAERFLYAVLPWLRVKRAEAEMALGFRMTFQFPLDVRLRQEREAYVKCAAWLKRLAVGRADPNEVERDYAQGPRNGGQ